jgi:hypothetical protein
MIRAPMPDAAPSATRDRPRTLAQSLEVKGLQFKAAQQIEALRAQLQQVRTELVDERTQRQAQRRTDARHARDRGFSSADIARFYGFNISTVQRWLRDDEASPR